MSNESIRKVGIELIAKNSDAYLKILAQANDGLAQYTERIKAATSAANASDASAKKISKQTDQIAKDFTTAKKAVEIYQAQLAKGLTGANLAGSQDFIDKTQDSLERSTRSLEDFNTRVKATGSEANKLGSHFTSVSSAIGASRVGVALFTRELVQMAGGGGVAVQALDSFVYATGTLGVALGAVTAGLVLIRGGIQSVTDDFKKQEVQIGNTARSYADVYNARLKAQQGGTGLFSLAGTIRESATDALVGAYGKQLGDTYGKAFTSAFKGDLVGLFTGLTENLNLGTAWFNLGVNAGNAFIEGFKRRQQEAATDLFVAGAQNRANAQALQLEIGQLQIEGRSFDELVPKIYAYLQAKKAIGEAEGSGIGGAITGADVESFAQSFFPTRALSDKATSLARSLRDIQAQYNEDSENLAVAHSARLDEIAASGYEQQIRIEREFLQRRNAIQAQYDQDVADAGDDYRSRLADAEADAQDRRAKIAQTYADRREDIERNYQERIAQILSDYQNSLFDIVARDDAKGLVRARLQRDKALADAAKNRDKENAENQKNRDRQEKELRDSLEKQKREIEQAYEKRLRDLAQAFAKQNAQNSQNYRDQLADLNENIARQYAAENDGYRKSQAALDKANEKKKQALIDALVEVQGLSEKYAQAIIDSLKTILDPATIIELTNDLQKALDTKIEIKVTPNASVPTGDGDGASGGKQGKTYAEGGYIERTQRALIHAGETVLPQNPKRAYELAMQHMGRVSMPMGARGAFGGNAGGVVKIYVDNSLDSAMLSSQIRTESVGVTTEIVNRARRGY